MAKIKIFQTNKKDKYLNLWERPGQRQIPHLLKHLLRAPLMPRQHQIGGHIHKVVVVRCVGEGQGSEQGP